MFKLQAYDWTLERWVPAQELRAQVRADRKAGISHLGVYPLIPDQGDIPDRLFEGHPAERLALRDSLAH